MKASKKVMESVIVSGLALTLAVTAVTGNGVNIAAKDAADTQFVNNGIAGVASAMNEYELESADYLDRYISVEKTNAALVAATADGTVISGNDTSEETTEKESVSEEEQEWQNKLMAKVDDFLYVREKADSDSEIVGKMYKGDRAVVKEAGDTWTKIESGNVTGYVKNEYCVTGTDALNYAKKHCDTVAKVSIDGLRIRKAPDTDAEVVKTVASGEHMDVNTKAEETDGWIAVKVGSDTCYVSDDYVTVTLDTGKAVTIGEEQAAIKAAEEKKAAEEAKKKAEEEAKKKAAEELAAKAEEEARKKAAEEAAKAEAEAKAKAEEARKILEAAKKAEEEALKAAEQADSIQIDLTQPAEEGKLPLAASYLEKYTKMEKSGKSLVDTFNAITVDQENRNVCMMGDHGFGLTSVGEDFARSFYDMGICKAKTIAKIKAQALNKVKLADAMSKLAGGCMVVENAGLIAPDKMTELMKLTAKDVNDVVVILTGATESINRLFGATGDAKDKFTHQINMEGISTQDMLAIAKGYFKQQGFKTDDSVEGTVKNLLMAMESGNIDRMLKACDEAMLKCDDREKAKGSSRKYLLSEDFK